MPDLVNGTPAVTHVIAQLQELTTPTGRVWRFVTNSEGVADHAWQQRDRLLQLSNGATAVEIHWHDPASTETPVVLAYSPALPAAGVV